ncbi:mitochondrial fission factor homolog B-like isoform 3-T3 [Polymixia lowei]
MTSFTPYPREMSEARGRDPRFTEAINQNMRIPERLSMGPGQQWGEDEARRRVEDPPPAYSMHIPDRLTYTETPDMSPRPLFTPSKPVLYPPQVLETCWESPSATRDGEAFFRDFPQVDYQTRETHLQITRSPMRRSYSDQGFGRTPPGTPTHTKQTLALHGHPSSSFSHHENPTPQAALTDASPHTNVEQARRSVMESWSLEDEGGAAVEFIVLRRQVMKMSRRLAGLERQNTERRNTEVVLFSLLLSACLLNAWLWIRR